MNIFNQESKLFFLAPMASYTDLPFRSVIKKFGCDMTFSEMINANAIAFDNEKTLKMMKKSKNESPYFVQIAVNNIDNMKKAVEKINNDDTIDGIDLNLGCPVNKARKSGYGGILLKDENRDILKEIVYNLVKFSKKPVSIKMRLGFDKFVADERAKMFEDLGVKFITVHGRYVTQMYKGVSDYSKIKKVVDAVSIDVIANGDITSYDKAEEVLNYTNARGVAIGRGVVGKPWIFLEMKQKGSISKNQKKEVILEHFNEMIKFYSSYGVILFRKHAHSYSKGIERASEFRKLINSTTDIEEVKHIINEFF